MMNSEYNMPWMKLCLEISHAYILWSFIIIIIITIIILTFTYPNSFSVFWVIVKTVAVVVLCLILYCHVVVPHVDVL